MKDFKDILLRYITSVIRKKSFRQLGDSVAPKQPVHLCSLIRSHNVYLYVNEILNNIKAYSVTSDENIHICQSDVFLGLLA